MLSPLRPAKSIRRIFIFMAFFLLVNNAFSQQTTPAYPRMVGYFSVYHPVETLSSGSFTGNFGKAYTVSFPFGLHILKSDHFGVSFEISPCIRTEHNISKVSSVAFNPGALFRFTHGYTLVSRLAFESSGRFGFTPALIKVLKRGKDCNLFTAVAFPARFGNNLASTFSSGLQLGVTF
ncbi:hypothetical protein MgSA37_00880 [Mucilaginibacter gotjawali]|uniref:Outer membrane protein beta-barrel domain-containing protein n=2 Tax=Mucilaginibacter gotjawali TaxID=1550579 RepID=A0A110B1I9_9SPHI|nr:hypothetical protein MgSA37_00880 [Mucilaginibacter gotjawali]